MGRVLEVRCIAEAPMTVVKRLDVSCSAGFQCRSRIKTTFRPGDDLRLAVDVVSSSPMHGKPATPPEKSEVAASDNNEDNAGTPDKSNVAAMDDDEDKTDVHIRTALNPRVSAIEHIRDQLMRERELSKAHLLTLTSASTQVRAARQLQAACLLRRSFELVS